MDLQDIDFRSPEIIANPYPTYALLREKAPIFYHEASRMTFISRYEDVDDLLRDRRLGRQFSHVMTRAEAGLPPLRPEYEPFHRLNDNMLMDKEPPQHTRLRALVQNAFTPRTVQSLRPHIEGIVEGLVERLLAQKEVDVIEAYAAPLSVTVIAELLGIPQADRQRLRPWSRDIVAMYELGAGESGETGRRAVQATQEFSDYLRALVQQRRKSPQDDLLSALVAAEERGDQLSEEELIATSILILNAGHEATVNAVGNGILALIQHPGQLATLRQNTDLIASAVEEILRYDTPLPLFRRRVLREMEYKNVHLAKGTEVAFLLGSANRDGARFEQPDRFDITRQDNHHLSFGMGVHYCLGAPLARVELQISLQSILRRVSRLELTVDRPERQNTLVFRGLKALPVLVA